MTTRQIKQNASAINVVNCVVYVFRASLCLVTHGWATGQVKQNALARNVLNCAILTCLCVWLPVSGPLDVQDPISHQLSYNQVLEKFSQTCNEAENMSNYVVRVSLCLVTQGWATGQVKQYALARNVLNYVFCTCLCVWLPVFGPLDVQGLINHRLNYNQVLEKMKQTCERECMSTSQFHFILSTLLGEI